MDARLMAMPVLALLLVMTSVGPAFAQQPAGSPDVAAIDAYVRSEIADAYIPGAALAIVHGDQIAESAGRSTAGATAAIPCRPPAAWTRYTRSTRGPVNASPELIWHNGSTLDMHATVLLHPNGLGPGAPHTNVTGTMYELLEKYELLIVAALQLTIGRCACAGGS